MASGKKKKPAWLTGEPSEETVVSQQTPRTGGRKGPLAEDDTGNLLTADSVRTAVAEEEARAQTRTIPRVEMPEAGAGAPAERPSGGNSARQIIERLRENPMPLVGALLALAVFIGVLVIIFGGGGGEGSQTAERGPSEGAQNAQRLAADPFAGGPVSDSGVAFEPLQESGDTAALSGAGLDWTGSVSEKEGGQGQTLTLDGPTAAQLERGFDVGNFDVEPGVYAVAERDSGEVFHVTTQILVPQDQDRAGEELTLGTVLAFEDDEFSGFAYFLDRRDEGSNRVTRTYFGPSIKPYRASYQAPALKAKEGDRNGAFVPLLVGWQGFEDDQTTGEE